MTTFGERLRNLRIEHDLSQQELADYLTEKCLLKGGSQTSISKWELAEDTPAPKTIRALADFFGVSLLYLYGAGDLELQIQQLKDEIDRQRIQHQKEYKQLERGVYEVYINTLKLPPEYAVHMQALIFKFLPPERMVEIMQELDEAKG